MKPKTKVHICGAISLVALSTQLLAIKFPSTITNTIGVIGIVIFIPTILMGLWYGLNTFYGEGQEQSTEEVKNE